LISRAGQVMGPPVNPKSIAERTASGRAQASGEIELLIASRAACRRHMSGFRHQIVASLAP